MSHLMKSRSRYLAVLSWLVTSLTVNHIDPAVAMETSVDPSGNASRYRFGSCGAKGQLGPVQGQCDAVYRNPVQKVKVTKGIQTWVIPEDGQYSVTILGASGGSGAQSVGESKGAYVHGKFNLTKGQKVHLIVGQEGWHGCSEIGDEEVKKACGGGLHGNAPNRAVSGGGGGGGGATYVFLGDLGTSHLKPLLVAGGGGGLGYNVTHPDPALDGGQEPAGPGTGGHSTPTGAGAGGGWKTSHGDHYEQSGASVLGSLYPGRGGNPCPGARVQGWSSGGGFGGGGGGCLNGGGGGGFTGGNASCEVCGNDMVLTNGMGGTSFLDPFAQDPGIKSGIHRGSGMVEFHLSVDCPCSFLCVVDSVKREFECHCPVNMSLAKDGFTCVEVITIPEKESMEVSHIVILCSGVLLIFLLLIGATLVVQYRRRKVARRVVREMPPVNLTSDPDLGQGLRPLGRRTEVNLYYDFAGTDMVMQDLVQIPRDDLALIRPLGQGAFGEVYEGVLSNFQTDKSNMAVAVKTLPAISTDQAKLDFLMEAVIISKFQHPNIVKFIGICMDKHPGFIVLELLEGGDLKTFLRESRRKADAPCPLSVGDLLKLAVDVAQGCKHLEQDHFIHRDIAARNCLLTSKGPDRAAKIADFGMARDVYRADYYKKGGRAMLPVKWMPPEAYMDGIFTTKTDVWSFGVLLWEVFSMGLMPYPGRSNQDVMEYVTAGGRMGPPDKCPARVHNLMMSCWHVSPEKRLSFQNIIKKLHACLQNQEVLSAPVASNPLRLQMESSFTGEEASPSSTAPLLSPQTPDPTVTHSPEDLHQSAFSKLQHKGYSPVPLQDTPQGEVTPTKHQHKTAADRGRLSFDFTSKRNSVAFVPPVLSGSSPNIGAMTNSTLDREESDENEKEKIPEVTSSRNKFHEENC